LANTPLVEDIYVPNLVKEAVQVFGADDPAHPSVAYLRNYGKDRYLGGKVQAIQSPIHFDYVALRCEATVVIYLKFNTDISLSVTRHAF
jgi:ATP sulfurylase